MSNIRDLPSKHECFYVLEMLETRLLDFTYTQPWANEIIKELETIPDWIFRISTNTALSEQSKALREYVFSEPFESAPAEIEKFHIACYWHRHLRREISWATFLNLVGRYLDTAGIEWDCETPYYYLNITEDAYFSIESEKETKNAYFQDHNLQSWVSFVAEKYEPFRSSRIMRMKRN